MVVKVINENSKSRSGKHHRIISYVVVDTECRPLKYVVKSRSEERPTYVVGRRYVEEIEVPDDALVIQLDFRRGIRGRVNGDVVIYDSKGELIGRAVYRKMKVRLVDYVSTKLLDIIKCVLRRAKVPVKRYGVIKAGRKV